MKAQLDKKIKKEVQSDILDYLLIIVSVSLGFQPIHIILKNSLQYCNCWVKVFSVDLDNDGLL